MRNFLLLLFVALSLAVGCRNPKVDPAATSPVDSTEVAVDTTAVDSL